MAARPPALGRLPRLTRSRGFSFRARGDEKVSAQRHLEPAGENRAVDRADHRRGHLGHPGDAVVRLVALEVGHALALSLFQVDSGAERGGRPRSAPPLAPTGRRPTRTTPRREPRSGRCSTRLRIGTIHGEQADRAGAEASTLNFPPRLIEIPNPAWLRRGSRTSLVLAVAGRSSITFEGGFSLPSRRHAPMGRSAASPNRYERASLTRPRSSNANPVAAA